METTGYKEWESFPPEVIYEPAEDGGVKIVKTITTNVVRSGTSEKILIRVGLKESIVSAGATTLGIPWTDQFQIIQIGGTVPQDITSDVSTFGHSSSSIGSESSYVQVWEPCCGSGGETGHEAYADLSIPDPPALPLGGQINRIYSQEELDYLGDLGIEPQTYSISIQ